jgi:fatty acid desaturase
MKSETTRSPVEWPTLLVVACVYATLGLLVWFNNILPWWIIMPIGTYAATLHSSLQHEVLHGHPTRLRWLNEALVFITPSFWLPFQRYRETHLTHHNNAHLTDPERDPESYYILPDAWANSSVVKRSLYSINQTLAGRMLIGPAVGIVRFWSAEFLDVMGGDRSKAGAWLLFAVSAIPTLGYVAWCGMPLWKYYLLIAYPSISVALVRSYCEHQAAERIEHRTIVVECSAFWSLLFLNNNLHVAHHERPSLAWYKLPAYYRSEREALIRQNNGYRMSYADMFWCYFLRAKEPIPYPNTDWLKP